MSNVVVVLSGGLDSTVLLYHHLHVIGDRCRAISIDYGQRHVKELHSAFVTCDKLHIPHTIVDLSSLASVLPGSSQTDKSIPVPEGHYEEESMKQTVVPNRNMILLSIAIGHAVAHKFDAVSYAAHAGDHAIYPDCREEFAKAMADTTRLCDWHVVELLRPFVRMTKAGIVAMGIQYGVPLEETWSCYKGEDLHCGKCGTCVERREAFKLAGVVDPTPYQLQ